MSHSITYCPKCGGRHQAPPSEKLKTIMQNLSASPGPASPVEPDTAELTTLAATLITRATQEGRGWELKKVFEAFLTVYPPETPEVPQLSAQQATSQLSADAQWLLQKAQQQMTVNYDGVPDAPSVLLTSEEQKRHQERQRAFAANRQQEAEPFMEFDAPPILLAK